MATNTIRIEQDADGDLHWAEIVLRDQGKAAGTLITGTWEHTDQSYNGKRVTFTSDNPEYYYFRWEGQAGTGRLTIGTKMGDYDDQLIILTRVQRTTAGAFRVSHPAVSTWAGTLKHATRPHFIQGEVFGRPV